MPDLSVFGPITKDRESPQPSSAELLMAAADVHERMRLEPTRMRSAQSSLPPADVSFVKPVKNKDQSRLP